MFRKKSKNKYASSTKNKYTENSIFSIIKKAKAKSNGTTPQNVSTTPHSMNNYKYSGKNSVSYTKNKERNNKFFTQKKLGRNRLIRNSKDGPLRSRLLMNTPGGGAKDQLPNQRKNSKNSLEESQPRYKKTKTFTSNMQRAKPSKLKNLSYYPTMSDIHTRGSKINRKAQSFISPSNLSAITPISPSDHFQNEMLFGENVKPEYQSKFKSGQRKSSIDSSSKSRYSEERSEQNSNNSNKMNSQYSKERTPKHT